ncbi:MAG TPA: guanylate kinase [Clostridiales bacterium]|nr:guanylate kinase [Clostridiales bacterium]
MSKSGILFIISGPSGAGKGTIRGKVMEKEIGLTFSVSATTRAPRPGEIDGLHYHFKTKEEFTKMIENNEFIEYVAKFQNYYGTPKAQVESLLKEGKDVLLEIETIGARNVRKMFPDAVMIFVTPSSFEELERRLLYRGTESEKVRNLRLKIAKKEYKSMKRYDYIAINDDLDQCVNLVCSIIRAERAKRFRNLDIVEHFNQI